MVIKKHLDVAPSEEMPGVMKRDVISAADGAPNFCMRVFELQPGASTPYHNHPWEHEVYLIDGEGVVVSEEGETPIGSESVVFVPVNEQHCFRNTGKEKMHFVCVIPN